MIVRPRVGVQRRTATRSIALLALAALMIGPIATTPAQAGIDGPSGTRLISGTPMPADPTLDPFITGRRVPCTPDPLDPSSGCLPTPVECALGLYPGHYTRSDGAIADCVGGGGHIVHYEGGYLSNDGVHPLCGGIIENDRAQVGVWMDPNLCGTASAPPGYGVEGRAISPLITSAGGVIATESPFAARAGIDILDRGGNAMDAAVGTAFALGVANPAVCGLGAVGQLVYRSASGQTDALDFLGTAPAAAYPDMLQRDGIDQMDIGHRMVSVPGFVAGMNAALKRYGTLELRDAIAPAEELARVGVPVSPGLALWYSATDLDPVTHIVPTSTRLRMFPETATTFLRGGALEYPPDNPMARSILVQPNLARSLALIATQGPDAFYEVNDVAAFDYHGVHYGDGPSIGKMILLDMENARQQPLYPGDAPVEWTTDDLSEYKAVWRDPLEGTYRGAKVITEPPTSWGGTVMMETLNIMEGFPLGSTIKHSSADYFHLFAEAFKLAWQDDAHYLGDPDFANVPFDVLTSKGFAAERRKLIDPARAQDYPAGDIPGHSHSTGRVDRISEGDRETTSLSVIDRSGNAVALTCTLGALFGTGVVPPNPVPGQPGAGFALNDELNWFDPSGTPRPNQAGGGHRPLSPLTPTIVVEHGQPVLAVGGAGGETIPWGVLLAVSNVVDYDMDVAHALDAPRLWEYCLETPNCPQGDFAAGMFLEDSRVLLEVIEELKRRGHTISYGGEYGGLPLLHAVGKDLSSRRNTGASDSRSERGTLGQS